MKKTVKKAETPKKRCSMCGKEKVTTNFYSTPSPLFADNLAPFCKTCLFSSIEGMDLKDGLMEVLQKIDRPFINIVWNTSLKSKNNPIGEYLKNVASLHQYKNLTFKDSEVEKMKKASGSKHEVMIKEKLGEDFEITADLILKWGQGYSDFEYMKLEKYYNDMMQSYEIETPQHKTDLEKLAKLNIKMDRLIEEDDFANIQKLGATISKIQQDAGFRAIDRKSGAEATGLFSFSQVWAKIEQEGFVEPKQHDYDKDDIDYMLMYYVQFTQRLAGKEVSVEPNQNWRNEVVESE